ncbi:pentapeptide repeat-containing protein [Streptomyces sp. NPDC005907]|uniref:pentapeptide repeat-containing protein n=1 Tax=Streptomyces sp. NPDC005907 TaxID=3154571 RepID=UPI0033C7EA11
MNERIAKLWRKQRVRKRLTRALGVLGSLILLIGIPWLVWRGPYALDREYLDREELAKGSAALVSGLRTALVAMLAAIGAGVALVYTARTYRLTRRGQITDRFNKALERLGSEHEYVRIGGVLNLEQIVQDSPEQAAPDAARVLVHFIRNRAPKAQHSRRKRLACMRSGDNTSLPVEPAADIQAALTALTSDVMCLHADPRVVVLDLHGLHLAGAMLPSVDLTDTHLEGVDLSGADLNGATLAMANLKAARLTSASLIHVDLTHAELAQADLRGADLELATWDKTDLRGANLSDASGLPAHLRELAHTDDRTVLPAYLRSQGEGHRRRLRRLRRVSSAAPATGPSLHERGPKGTSRAHEPGKQR